MVVVVVVWYTVPKLVRNRNWREMIGCHRCLRGWIDGRDGTTWKTEALDHLRRQG